MVVFVCVLISHKHDLAIRRLERKKLGNETNCLGFDVSMYNLL